MSAFSEEVCLAVLNEVNNKIIQAMNHYESLAQSTV